MASADFCNPIPIPLDNGSQWQDHRPPRVMRVTFPLIPAASTFTVSVQALGFEDNGLLTPCDRLLCDFCSSGQCFAFDFLQIPPRDGHPCRSANRSPYRADSGLSPPSHPTATTRIGTALVTALRAMPGAPQRNLKHNSNQMKGNLAPKTSSIQDYSWRAGSLLFIEIHNEVNSSIRDLAVSSLPWSVPQCPGYARDSLVEKSSNADCHRFLFRSAHVISVLPGTRTG
jgi:hypothetical protein